MHPILNYLKTNILVVVAFGLIIFLFIQNQDIRDELKKARYRISDLEDRLGNDYSYGDDIISRIDDLEYEISDLEDEIQRLTSEIINLQFQVW